MFQFTNLGKLVYEYELKLVFVIAIRLLSPSPGGWWYWFTRGLARGAPDGCGRVGGVGLEGPRWPGGSWVTREQALLGIAPWNCSEGP